MYTTLSLINLSISLYLYIHPFCNSSAAPQQMKEQQNPSVEFRLFRLEDRLDRLLKKIESSFAEELLKEAEEFLEPRLLLTITNSIDQFYKASEISKNKLTIENIVQSKLKEIEPALKNNILKENRIMIDAELREIKNPPAKKKEQNKDPKQTTPAEIKEKLEFLFSEVEDLNSKHRRNYEFTQNIEKLSYDRIDEMRHTIQLAVQQLTSTKTELTKYFTDTQVLINQSKLYTPEKEQRRGLFQELSQQVVKSLSRSEFENIHLKQISSQYQYLKDEIGALKLILNNNSEYQRHMNRTVEKIERFSGYLTEHEARRQEVEKLNLKARMEKLEVHVSWATTKSTSLDKNIEQLKEKILDSNNNLVDISASFNMQLNNLKNKVGRLEVDSSLHSQMKDQYFVPLKQEMGTNFRKVFEQMGTYDLITEQISLMKEEFIEVSRALSIMDAKLGMFKQELPRFQKPSEESDRETKKSVLRHQSIDETARSSTVTGHRAKPSHNPFTHSRYSVKFLKSIVHNSSRKDN